uniref:ABC-type Fe3+-siderophore transport system, permease component n=1 Tax=uncultured gamma proteobacterium HF0200_24F15 TaxID=723570 RepID=E7C3Z5_9GAMM|nr:ABC-type Fe3+-siderophore transport system, permease component [uncultured gamma proteobacterium HF0200_24F15]
MSYNRSLRANRFLLILLIAAGFCFLIALSFGSAPIEWTEVLGTLKTGSASFDHTVVMELRLPRAASAFVVGGMLALAGVLMQVLLRNPLADPYVLGISGGAAVAALIAMLIGWQSGLISTAAAGGAMISMALVFTLARGRGDWSSTRLLLTGVVLASGWGAGISFILAVSPSSHLYSMLFWMMGDFNDSGPGLFRSLFLVVSLFGTMLIARNLNLIALGEIRAEALGRSYAGCTDRNLSACQHTDGSSGHTSRHYRFCRSSRSTYGSAHSRI